MSSPNRTPTTRKISRQTTFDQLHRDAIRQTANENGLIGRITKDPLYVNGYIWTVGRGYADQAAAIRRAVRAFKVPGGLGCKVSVRDTTCR
jgi:hypothetical protein